MNIACNLEFFRQIVAFEADASRCEIIFINLDRPKQRAIQAIAHSRNLEYECQRGCAKVFRDSILDDRDAVLPGDIGLENQDIFDPNTAPGLFGSPTQAGASHDIPTPYLPDFSLLDDYFLPNNQPPQYDVPHQVSDLGIWDGVQSNNVEFSQHDMALNLGRPMGDEDVPILDLRYPGFESHDAPSSPYGSRSMSVSPFEVFPSGALANMPSYEEFSAVLPNLPSDYPQSPYRGNSRSNSMRSFTSTQLSPVASPRMTPHNRPRLSSRGRKNISRSGSVNSIQSESGTRSNRRPSSFSFSHSVDMTSKKRRSTSRASSTGSGRSGPVYHLTRMGMKAVKAVGGACWRCKFLGKKASGHVPRQRKRANLRKCTKENPCETCPNRSKSGKVAWTTVGCQRGTLSEVMEPVVLCPKQLPSTPAFNLATAFLAEQASQSISHCVPCEHFWCREERGYKCPKCGNHAAGSFKVGPLEQVELSLDTIKRRREEDILQVLGASDEEKIFLGPALPKLRKHDTIEDLGLTDHITSPHHALITMGPLDRCILTIVWELVESPEHLLNVSFFKTETELALEKLVVLLRTAALYQAKLDTVSMVNTF